MRVAYPAVKIVWNPSRRELLLGPEPLWSLHRMGRPTIVLARSERPTRRALFEVPDVPAGTYIVATFDGGEGGFHYTWDDFRVVASSQDGGDQHRDAYDLIFWLTIAGGGLLVADVLVQLRRPSRRWPTARL